MNSEGFLKRLESTIIVGDGAMGTMIQRLTPDSSRVPELLMLKEPELILGIHKEYLEAGSELIETNTFGANRIKLASAGLAEKVREINELAVQLARKAAGKKAFIAGSIGPSGKLMEPYGELSINKARENFSEQLSYLYNSGIDLIIIETMSDLAEAKAALLAAQEFKIPVIAQMTFTEKGKTLTGISPEVMAIVMEGLGADLIGVNCVAGLEEALPILERISSVSSLPLTVYANGGIPVSVKGKTCYPQSAEDYVSLISELFKYNIGVIGGCCGTTPEYIKEIKIKLDQQEKGYTKRDKKTREGVLYLSGNRKYLAIKENSPVYIIGENLNPTGRGDIKKSLIEERWSYLRKLAREQVEAGAKLIDINIGLPGIDKIKVMKNLIQELQLEIGETLVIDSNDPAVLEEALQVYIGKPIVNSVNGEQKVMDQIFPLVKKYGTAVIALTLDDQGIPSTVEGRIAIARRIIREAAKYDIKAEDIIIDTLTLTAGSEQGGIMTTLETLKRVKEELGVKTTLGISNISHGLPERELINHVFLNMAIAYGLDLPIANPFDQKLQHLLLAANLLTNRDQGGVKFLEHYGRKYMTERKIVKGEEKNKEEGIRDRIHSGVIDGDSKEIISLIKASLLELQPEDIVNTILIPAIREVGELYDQGIYFLPQLLKSAETMQIGFDYLKGMMVKNKEGKEDGTILLATVKGDIHDIGKNIVKVIFMNHGYEIIDLGTNVDRELIVKTAIDKVVDFVGLSSLMTTTLGELKKVIELLHKKRFQGKTIIGGAVTSQEYAEEIGADIYARDALDGVRKANEILVKRGGEYFGRESKNL